MMATPIGMILSELKKELAKDIFLHNTHSTLAKQTIYGKQLQQKAAR